MKTWLILTTASILMLLSSFVSPSPTGSYFYQGSFDNALRLSRKLNKPILLDFWAVWCGPCQKMDKETFTDAALSNFLQQHYIVYRVDVDTPDGAAIAHRFYVASYPAIVILSERGKFQQRLSGFYPANYLQKELQNHVVARPAVTLNSRPN